MVYLFLAPTLVVQNLLRSTSSPLGNHRLFITNTNNRRRSLGSHVGRQTGRTNVSLTENDCVQRPVTIYQNEILSNYQEKPLKKKLLRSFTFYDNGSGINIDSFNDVKNVCNEYTVLEKNNDNDIFANNKFATLPANPRLLKNRNTSTTNHFNCIKKSNKFFDFFKAISNATSGSVESITAHAADLSLENSKENIAKYENGMLFNFCCLITIL